MTKNATTGRDVSEFGVPCTKGLDSLGDLVKRIREARVNLLNGAEPFLEVASGGHRLALDEQHYVGQYDEPINGLQTIPSGAVREFGDANCIGDLDIGSAFDRGGGHESFRVGITEGINAASSGWQYNSYSALWTVRAFNRSAQVSSPWTSRSKAPLRRASVSPAD